jgi:hypothetical protein
MSMNEQAACTQGAVFGDAAGIASLIDQFPAPIIHNKRLGEILFAMMSEIPSPGRRHRRPACLDIVTCHNYPAKSLFEKSLEHLGIEDCIVLKRTLDGPWRNTFKLRWMLDHLAAHPSGPEYVLFCDADDTILKDDPAVALDLFLRRECELLFMSTSFTGGYACMPEVKRWADHIRPGRYLNSGVYIGRRAFISDVLKRAAAYITDDDITAENSKRLGHGVLSTRLCDELAEYPRGSQDQDILRYLHPEFYPDMQIDYDNRLAFRNM